MAIGKTELAQRVAHKAGVSRSSANSMVNTVFDEITAALAGGDEVRITGFGSFRVVNTKARTGRNPRTGQAINIPAGRRAAFSAGSKLQEGVGKR